jgi:hypothetical protein
VALRDIFALARATLCAQLLPGNPAAVVAAATLIRGHTAVQSNLITGSCASNRALVAIPACGLH